MSHIKQTDIFQPDMIQPYVNQPDKTKPEPSRPDTILRRPKIAMWSEPVVLDGYCAVM
jgi:hypothetical protein